MHNQFSNLSIKFNEYLSNKRQNEKRDKKHNLFKIL